MARTVVERDSSGAAIVRPSGELGDDDREPLRRMVFKLLAEQPGAILVDLSGVPRLSRLVQATLLALSVEAAREPSTPFLLCTPDPQTALALDAHGRMMRVFSSVAEAQAHLASGPQTVEWFHQPLGREIHAPSIAACYVADACSAWRLPELLLPAHAVTFDLVWMARGPHDLHLTVALRPEQSLLINVRNYDAPEPLARSLFRRLPLDRADRARLMADGAMACGQLITEDGFLKWASLTPA